MSSDGMRQIGEVAETVGLSQRTIRHWDEVDLVPPSGRSAGGFRLYTEADIERLRLVKSLKPLDLSLEEIRELLSIRDQLGLLSEGGGIESLRERLSTYADRAETRCLDLRAQLDEIERLARRLRNEANGEADIT
ncbi:MAG: MerR family transcriptional regulator [Aquihabitans sp.]